MTELLVNACAALMNPELDLLLNPGVAFEKGRILAVGDASDLRSQFPDAAVHDARGGLVLPAMVNLHHHFYSQMATGLNPGLPIANFPETLDRLWWRLDRAHDRETVGLSAALAACDSLASGCGTVFDHHASPAHIDGILDVIAEAMQEAGLRAVLCYEVTDRGGHEKARAGLAENERFAQSVRASSHLRGMLGLHASFTLSDETLKEAARIHEQGLPIHIHVAEHPVDMESTLAEDGMHPVERLHRFGLLDERALLIHGIHLDDTALDRVAERRAALVFNPESNANNGVGFLDIHRVRSRGCRLGLGTDGMDSAMLRALRTGFLLARAHGISSGDAAMHMQHALATNARFARQAFQDSLIMTLQPGAPADFTVVDYQPTTPITQENAIYHLIFGASRFPIRHTVIHGRFLYRDFQFTQIDRMDLATRARSRARELWKTFQQTPEGLPFRKP